MTDEATRVVAVNRGVEHAPGPGPTRGPEHEALDVWVGRWVNEGHLVNEDGSRGPAIVTSDVYEWAPGGFFVVHVARSTVTFGDDGRTQSVLHERTDDGTTFAPCMRVTLRKVA